jgi:UDP-glucose 4-epimerase
VSLLVRCAQSPRAAGRTFLAGDPDAVSTPRLFNVVRAALARPARLFGMPASALEAAASLAGQGDRMRRLTRSLEVDCRDAMETLEWAPRRPMDEALHEMARSAKEAA